MTKEKPPQSGNKQMNNTVIQKLPTLNPVGTALSTATGTDYSFFGETRLIAPRKGWVDTFQDRYRIRGTAAGVNVEEPHQQMIYFLRPQAKVAIRKFQGTVAVVFDPADVVRTEVYGPRNDTPSIYDDGPLLDFMQSPQYRYRIREGRRTGRWM
jgi:hypothetical protein